MGAALTAALLVLTSTAAAQDKPRWDPPKKAAPPKAGKPKAGKPNQPKAAQPKAGKPKAAQPKDGEAKGDETQAAPSKDGEAKGDEAKSAPPKDGEANAGEPKGAPSKDGEAAQPDAKDGAAAGQGPKGSCPPKAFCEHAEVGPPKTAKPAGQDAAAANGDAVMATAPDEAKKADQRVPLDSESITWAPEGGVPRDDGNGEWKWTSSSSDDDMGPITTAGLVIFGIGYTPAFLTGLVAAAIEDSDAGGSAETEVLLPLLLPVFGPPITGALTDASSGVWTMLMVDSAVQAAGLIILGLGVALDDNDGKRQGSRPLLLPHVGSHGKHGMTVGVTGTF